MEAAVLATVLIVFRETLEAALFVGIVAAATRNVPHRGRWLSLGVGAGVAGAFALAAGAGQIGAWAEGVGQDLVNACILGLAFVMLAWHCIWVSNQSAQAAQEAQRIGRAAGQGLGPWPLVLAVALSVLREGAETVLFVAGLHAGAGAGAGWGAMALAVITGVGAGAAIGTLLYLGLSRVHPRNLFAVTNLLVLLLAASMASQLARSLAQAGLVEFGSLQLWDSSGLLATDSALGALLHALVGYEAQPSLLQLMAWLGALTLITLAARKVRQRNQQVLRPVG